MAEVGAVGGTAGCDRPPLRRAGAQETRSEEEEGGYRESRPHAHAPDCEQHRCQRRRVEIGGRVCISRAKRAGVAGATTKHCLVVEHSDLVVGCHKGSARC